MSTKTQSTSTQTLYQRLKIESKGWRYQRVKTGVDSRRATNRAFLFAHSERREAKR